MILEDTCTTVFIVVLFPKAQTWKQRNHPFTDDWVKKRGTHIQGLFISVQLLSLVRLFATP